MKTFRSSAYSYLFKLPTVLVLLWASVPAFAQLTTSVDPTFKITPALSSAPTFVAVDSVDRVLCVGGDFIQIVNGHAQRGIARFSKDGVLDQTFDCGEGFIGVNAIAGVHVQSDGNVVITGTFTSMAGITAKGCVRLSTLGKVDLGYRPTLLYPSVTLMDSKDRLYVQTQSSIRRLTSDGAEDISYPPITMKDGDALVAVALDSLDRIHLATGRSDPADVSQPPSSVNYLATGTLSCIAADGALVRSKLFYSALGSNYSRAAIRGATITPAEAGSILFCYSTDSGYSEATHPVVKLSADGSLDATFAAKFFARKMIWHAETGNVYLLQPAGIGVNVGVGTGPIRLNSRGDEDIVFSAAGLPSPQGSVSMTSNGALLIAGGGVVRLKLANYIPTVPVLSLPRSTVYEVSGISDSLSVQVTGLGPLTYQWKKNGTAVSTGSSFPLTGTSDDAGAYTVSVSNPYGTSTSGPIQVQVVPRTPSIVVQPQSRVYSPTTYSFAIEVFATGVGPLRYQWFKDGAPVVNYYSNSAKFALTGGLVPAGEYRVAVSNDLGLVLSDPCQITPLKETYFGTLNGGGQWALKVENDMTTTFIAFSKPLGGTIIGHPTIGPDGRFSVSVQTSGAGLLPYGLDSNSGHAKLSAALSVSGTIVGNAVTGDIQGTGFSGIADGSSGKSQFFELVGLGSVSASAVGITGPSGQTLLLTTGPTGDGALGTRGASGSFDSASFNGGRLKFTSGATLTATLTPAGATLPQEFSGLAAGVVSTSRLSNISTRAFCGTGNNVTIGGVVISGTGTKRVLVRAVGPTLGSLGIAPSELLQDPMITVYKGTPVLATNDNWGENTNAVEIASVSSAIGAYPFMFGDTKSAALLLDLTPGIYSFAVSGKGGSSGIVLVELYDADVAVSTAYFSNLSARVSCQTGNGVAIGGFVVSGNGPKRFLVRGVGPTLIPLGISATEALLDPMIELHRGTPLIAANDDYQSATNAQDVVNVGAAIGASPFDASDKQSAALLLNLNPGTYSFVASGKNQTSGIVIVEVYDAD